MTHVFASDAVRKQLYLVITTQYLIFSQVKLKIVKQQVQELHMPVHLLSFPCSV